MGKQHTTGTQAYVLSSAGGRFEVQAGKLKLKVKLDEVSPVGGTAKAPRTAATTKSKASKGRSRGGSTAAERMKRLTGRSL